MTNPTGEIGQLREEEFPVVRVVVPPDPDGRVFEDDLDPGDLVFDGKLTPMLVWHERYPVGRGWRSGWVLNYDPDGKGSADDYIVGPGRMSMPPWRRLASTCVQSATPRLAGRRHDQARTGPLVCQPLLPWRSRDQPGLGGLPHLVGPRPWSCRER